MRSLGKNLQQHPARSLQDLDAKGLLEEPERSSHKIQKIFMQDLVLRQAQSVKEVAQQIAHDKTVSSSLKGERFNTHRMRRLGEHPAATT